MPGIRAPAVAGAFYAGTAEALTRQIESAYRDPRGPRRLPEGTTAPLEAPVALVVPHAGYQYSGPIAAWGYAWLATQGRPDVVAIVGPDHRAIADGAALSSADAWQTPLGTVSLDQDLASQLRATCPSASVDDTAHAEEHSVEVQVPFLQHLYALRPPRLFPIVMGPQHLETSLELGRALASVLRGRAAALLASTDLSHYYRQSQARELDRHAIDAILTGIPSEVEGAVRHHGINMCGMGPVMAVLAAARELGLPKPELLSYANSGDVTGEASWVVGYTCIRLG